MQIQGFTSLNLKTNRSYDIRKQSHGLPYVSNHPEFKILKPKVKLKHRSILPKIKQTDISSSFNKTKKAFGNSISMYSTKSVFRPHTPSAIHAKDPRLVSESKVLPLSLEQEIREGFYELRQKFKQSDQKSIYISHQILHTKHPFFCKLSLETLKTILRASTVVSMVEGQVLYDCDQTLVYFVLFGRLTISNSTGVLGRATLGWTLGEEGLFDLQSKQEKTVCEKEACLISIAKDHLTELQAALLKHKRLKDYYALESLLKGNYLLKERWRRGM